MPAILAFKQATVGVANAIKRRLIDRGRGSLRQVRTGSE